MEPGRQRFPWPVLVLYFLSPVVGELLSSASPPVEFFSVFGLTVMSLLYGCGALLVRELSFRWGAGWPGRLLLGAAYGIVEEGLMVKSFFDPNWPDLGVLGTYGRIAAVNWVWSVELTLYHCFYSICIPILLVELTFPRWRERRWLNRPGLAVVGALLAADVVWGFVGLAPYHPPFVPYLGAWAATAALVVAAWRVRLPAGPVTIAPQQAADARRVPGPHALAFFLFGLACTLLFFLLNWVLPSARLVPPVVTVALVAGLVLGFRSGLRELVRAFSWTTANQWALASGALAFFVALASVVELDASRPDDPRGMRVVGLVAAALLLAGFLKVKQERRADEHAHPDGHGWHDARQD
jgi:hypothetical protein